MIDENFALLAAVFILFGDAKYLISAIQGKIKPNKITWFLWSLAPFIAFAAEIQQNVGISSITTAAFGTVPALIFVASVVNKKAHWKIQRFDLFCGFLSLMGLVLWYTTKIGNIAIIFSILADGFAAIPTVIKSFHHPETESYSAYLGSATGGIITLLTIKTWDFAHFGFPLYIFLICILLFVFIKFKPGKIFYKDHCR